MQQRSCVVVNVVVKTQKRVASLRFVFVVVIVASVHESLHNPFRVALLVLFVDDAIQMCGGRCCCCHRVGQLNIAVLWSKQQKCSFGVKVNVVERQRSSSLCGSGGESSKTATIFGVSARVWENGFWMFLYSNN